MTLFFLSKTIDFAGNFKLLSSSESNTISVVDCIMFFELTGFTIVTVQSTIDCSLDFIESCWLRFFSMLASLQGKHLSVVLVASFFKSGFFGPLRSMI